MKIDIVNNSPFELPQYKTAGSAGMDLKIDLTDPSQIVVKAGNYIPDAESNTVILEHGFRGILPTNIQIQLPDILEAEIRPRSSHSSETGLDVILGTIDSDFVGSVGVIVKNTTGHAIVIEHGERIAQMIITPVEHAEWVPATELKPTERGVGGFGSTGKK